MSLDVYLTKPGESRPAGSGIFVRENGQTVEITREEWDRKFPDREPVVVERESRPEVYSANITHNLGKMAREAGLYDALWRPDENGITKARQLIAPLTDGLARLHADPDRYRRWNPENGWGDYEGLVRFTALYLQACNEHPDADVSVWR